MIRTGQANIQTSRATHRTIMVAGFTAGINDAAPMKLAILDNEIAQDDYKQNLYFPIIVTYSEKTQSRN